MGRLFYSTATDPIEFPDRLLAHIKVVIATKLRRNESFTLSWKHSDEQETGRTTIWLQPAIPLRFVFDSAEPEKLNPSVLKHMVELANSSAGLTVDLAEAIPDTETTDAVRQVAAARVGVPRRTPGKTRASVAA